MDGGHYIKTKEIGKLQMHTDLRIEVAKMCDTQATIVSDIIVVSGSIPSNLNTCIKKDEIKPANILGMSLCVSDRATWRTHMI